MISIPHTWWLGPSWPVSSNHPAGSLCCFGISALPPSALRRRRLPRAWQLALCLLLPQPLWNHSSTFTTPLPAHACCAGHTLSSPFLGQLCSPIHPASKPGKIVDFVCQANNLASTSPSKCCPFWFVLCYTCPWRSLQLVMLAFSKVSLTFILPSVNPTCYTIRLILKIYYFNYISSLPKNPYWFLFHLQHLV